MVRTLARCASHFETQTRKTLQMTAGTELSTLVAEVERVDRAKRDFLVDSRKVSVLPSGRELLLGGADIGPVSIRPYAHGQLAEFTGIPKRYYDRMLNEAPDLLAANTNRWLSQEGKRRMIRTVDDECRAFLSNSYRVVDNLDFLHAVLPALEKAQVRIESVQFSETKLYLKAVMHGREELILPPGARMGEGHSTFHRVRPGIVISNSEVGAGAYAVQPAIYDTGCTNLAVSRKDAMRKYHVGRRQGGEGDDSLEIKSDRTRALEDASSLSHMADLVESALDGSVFERFCNSLRESLGQPIEKPVAETVELVRERFGFSEGESSQILDALVRSNDLTRHGLHAAVTRFSQDVEDYQRATELELVGGDILEMPKTAWAALALRN